MVAPALVKQVEIEMPAWVPNALEKFSPERKEKLLEFIEYLDLKGNSKNSIELYVKSISKLGYKGKPYQELTRDELIEWIYNLPKMNQRGGKYSEATLFTLKNHVKRFLKWAHHSGSPDTPLKEMEVPEVTECIDCKRPDTDLPEDSILSKDDIRKLVENANNQRDRALIFVTYESGTRASEVLGLTLGDIGFDEHGAILHVEGKTGRRRVRIVESVPDLQLWLEVLENDEPKTSLWPSLRGNTPLTVDGFEKMIKRCAKRAGFKKRIYPHLLRHSRATHLANVLTEAQMREFFGWAKSSDTPSKYIHLSGRDVDSTLLDYYGIKKDESKNEDTALKPKECPRCGKLNSAEAKYCSQCSLIISEKEAFESVKDEKVKGEALAKVTQWIIKENPKVLERALVESGVAKELNSIIN